MKKTIGIGRKMMAVFAVALLAVCAMSVCLVQEDSDAAYAKTFNIDMAAGSSFSYTPTFNLSTGTITVSSSGTAKDNNIITQTGTSGLNSSTSFAGTFSSGSTTGTSTQLVINATWKSSDNKLTQTATQTINFKTFTKVSLPSSVSTGKLSVVQKDYQTSGTTVATIKATGPSTVTTSGSFASGPFTATHSGGTCTIKTNKVLAAADAGTYSLTVTADDGNANYVDKVSKKYTFTVYKDLSVTVNTATNSNFVGNSSASTTYTFSVPDKGSATVTWAGSNPFGDTGITGSMNSSSGVYTVNVSNATRAKVFTGDFADADSRSFTITATATIKYPGNAGTASPTKTATFIMYRDFEFTSSPSVTGSTVYSASGNPLDVLLTADFGGTSMITYNWGDGTSTTIQQGPDSSSSFSARHVYEKPGTYVIVTTAYNSNGTMSSYTLYDAAGDSFSNESTEEDDGGDSFFGEHGYQFLVFVFITLVLFIAIVYFGFSSPVIIGFAVITGLLSVLCFVYNDLGGVIEQLKSLLKL